VVAVAQQLGFGSAMAAQMGVSRNGCM